LAPDLRGGADAIADRPDVPSPVSLDSEVKRAGLGCLWGLGTASGASGVGPSIFSISRRFYRS